MEIMPIRTDRLFAVHDEEYAKKAIEVLRSGQYIASKELAAFEEEYASYTGVSNCVGVACGLDALRITFRVLGLGRGDGVVVQGNTFIAGVMGITDCGATPVFAEPDEYFGLTAESIEAVLNPSVRAVLVTHLYGIMTPMDDIVELCERKGLLLIEDCAQAHGAEWQGKKAGSFGVAGCFSFYPAKNLGCFGDGGAIVTNDSALAEKMRIFRSYGSNRRYHNICVGMNSRLDEIQAGLLRVRLKYLDEMNAERNALAAKYSREINNPLIRLPETRPETYNVWHQYVVRCSRRNELRKHLEERGIHSLIHYPIPPHLSEAYSYLGFREGSFPKTEALCESVLSVPLYNCMTVEEQDYVISALNDFC